MYCYGPYISQKACISGLCSSIKVGIGNASSPYYTFNFMISTKCANNNIFIFDSVTRIWRFSLECFPNITGLWFSWTISKLLNTRGFWWADDALHVCLFPVQCFPRDLEIFLNLAFQHLCEANTIQMFWPCGCRQESWESREAFGRW